MSQNKSKIFISYSWEETQLINRIQKDFQSIGLQITRDVKDVKYKDSMSTFMSSIRDHEYCVALISESYLKSRNCMFEMLELMKESSFEDIVLPIITTDLNIFDQEYRISIIEYWENQSEKSKKEISSLDPLKADSEIKISKQIEFISLKISEFLSFLSDSKLVTVEECFQNNYKAILDFIGIDTPDLKQKLIEIEDIEDENKKEAAVEALAIEYPKNADINFKKAYLETVSKNNPEKAIVLWKDHISKYDNFLPVAYNNLASCYRDLEDYKKAEDAYKKALDLDYQDAEIHKNTGKFYFIGPSDVEQSVFHLEKAIELNPTDSEAYFLLGEIYLKSYFSYDVALECYEKSIEIDPSQLMPYVHSIAILIQQKRFDKAKKLAQKVVKLYPNDDKALVSMASYLIKSEEDIDKGISNLEKAISINPNAFMPYIQLAKAHVELNNDFEKAFSILDSSLDEVEDKLPIRMYAQELYSKYENQ